MKMGPALLTCLLAATVCLLGAGQVRAQAAASGETDPNAPGPIHVADSQLGFNLEPLRFQKPKHSLLRRDFG
jgi:hypothetical protein